MRRCLRDPVPEIEQAARDLNEAVVAHLSGAFARAEELIRLTDSPQIRADEVGLLDPRHYPPVQSMWDGLERFR
jgi:hypothetical protein